jgi:hypothetical protein
VAAWVVRIWKRRSLSTAAGVWRLRSRAAGARDGGGIASTPAGKGAWFKDSEGNVLTMTQRA